MRGRRTSPLQRVGDLLRAAVDFVFGFDFFVSYTHADGLAYPELLAEQLEAAGFRVFLDRRVYAPGDDLRVATSRRVRMSRCLCLLVRPGVARSRWVRREVGTALEAGRRLVLIDVDGAYDGLIENDPELREMLADRIRIHETADSPESGPSQSTLEALQRGFTSTRQEVLRQRAFAAAAVVFAALAAIAVWQFVIARQERDAAASQLAEALAQRADALAEPGGDILKAFLLAIRAADVSPASNPATAVHVARVVHLAASLPVRIHRLEIDQGLRSAALSPGLDALLAMTNDFGVRAFELPSGRRLATPVPDGARIGEGGDLAQGGPGIGAHLMEFSRDGSLAKIVVDADHLLVWNVADASVVLDLVLEDYDEPVFARVGTSLVGHLWSCDADEVVSEDGEPCRKVLWTQTPSLVPPEVAEPYDPDVGWQDDEPRLEMVYRGRRPVAVARADERLSGQHVETAPGDWLALRSVGDGELLAGVSAQGQVWVWDPGPTLPSRVWSRAPGQPVLAAAALSGGAVALLLADLTLTVVSEEGAPWSARVTRHELVPEIDYARLWPTSRADEFLLTYGQDKDGEQGGPARVELWQVGVDEPVVGGAFRHFRVQDVVLRDRTGGAVWIWGEEEYAYLRDWSFATPDSSWQYSVLDDSRYGAGMTRGGQLRLEGWESELRFYALVPPAEPLRPAPEPLPRIAFGSDREIGGLAAMRLLRSAWDFRERAGSIEAESAGGRFRLEPDPLGARLLLDGRPVRAAAGETPLGISLDGRFLAAEKSYHSGGGRIGSSQDLIFRDLATGRAVAGHLRLQGESFLQLTAHGRSALTITRDGAIREHYLHGDDRRVPAWFADLGRFAVGAEIDGALDLRALGGDELARARRALAARLEESADTIAWPGAEILRRFLDRDEFGYPLTGVPVGTERPASRPAR